MQVNNPKVLDLGCGSGILSYYLYHRFESINYTGVELKEKDHDNLFYNYDNGVFIGDLQNDEDKLYKFYCKVAKDDIEVDKPLSREEFKKEIEAKIYFGKNITDFLSDKKNCCNSFHLIVLSKVLHYCNVGCPKEVVKRCYNLLMNGGYIAITLTKKCSKTKRIEYNFNDLMDWTKDFSEIYSKDSSDIIYYLGRKD